MLKVGNETERKKKGVDPPANSMSQRVHNSGPSRSLT
jgi:hypothetical protein